MTSVERVLEYTSIKPEPLDKGAKKPPKDWPKYGRIEFKDVSFSYDPKLPNVLKEFSLVINPGEKIGVVGRTGAGKSSLFQTLFRMAEPNGQVLIDDVDIKDISLHELRGKIAIIPVSSPQFPPNLTLRHRLIVNDGVYFYSKNPLFSWEQFAQT